MAGAKREEIAEKDITDLKYFGKLAPLCASPREFRGAISRDLMAPETVRRRAVR